MRLHPLGAVLLAGWLLMLPPITADPKRPGQVGEAVRSELPVTDWEQYSAYDSAEQCERAREEIIGARGSRSESADERAEKPDAPAYIRNGADHTFRMSMQARYSRCVPPELVYPPRK
jgi:hypothetical protein